MTTEKKCNKCNTFRSVGEFYKNKKNPDGLKYSCKLCCKRYCKSNSSKIRDSYLKRTYGIDQSVYNQMLMNQHGKCAGCGIIQKGVLCVDHCHSTGVVRGLLCDRCNTTIGKFDEKPELIGLLASYVIENCMLIGMVKSNLGEDDRWKR